MIPRLLSALLCCGWVATEAAAQAPLQLRYDLAPGDHLVYTETFTRRVVSPSAESESRIQWTNHLLVLEGARGALVTGIQRNRTNAEMLRYREGGRDRLDEGRARFAAQIEKQPATFAEAVWVDAAGTSLLPAAVVREAVSQLLPAFRELLPLPAGPITVGAAWRGGGAMTFDMRAGACADPVDTDCLVLDGTAGTTRLSATFAPQRHLLTRLIVSGHYPIVGGHEVSEEIRFEFVKQSRGEAAAQWLDASETRQAVLEALLIATKVPVPATRLHLFAADPDPATQRRALAALWRHKLPPPPADLLERAAASASARVRTLAARHALRLAEGDARAALLQRARSDPDSFVRAIVERPVGPQSTSSESNGTPPGACLAETTAARRPRITVGQVPGVTLRSMATEPFTGWPYAIGIPEDYRGDEAYPLVLYLGGGPGRAVPTAQQVAPAFLDTGYIVAYAQADGMWWSDSSTRMVGALLDELLSTYNVDPDRVFIAGLSNGGTGTLHLASLWPHRFAAAAPTMAAELGKGVASNARPSTLGPLPVLLIHGTSDTVIDASEARRNRDRFAREAPATPLEFVLLEGRSHDIWPGADEGRTIAFFGGKRRPRVPTVVTLESVGSLPARAYWLELVERTGVKATVRAEVDAEGHVNVTAQHAARLRLHLVPGLVPAGRSLRVTVNGRVVFDEIPTSDCSAYAKAVSSHHDPELAALAVIDLDVRSSSTRSR